MRTTVFRILPLIPAFILIHIYFCFAQRTERQYLSGTDKDHTVTWDFFIDRGMNSGTWTTIPVPSNWETEGFGVYNYGRNRPFQQPESDETAIYRYQFEVKPEWKNKTVYLVFEGVMTDTRVLVNGTSAGPVHQGGFYEFKYDVTKLLNYSKTNELEVTVNNWSANESVNKAERQADFWIFGGIYRPVYLEAKPEEHIDRIAVDARMHGEFKVDVYLKNNRSLQRIEARIYTPDNKRIGDPIYMGVEKKQQKVTLASFFRNIRQWSPEFPHLYTVEVSIFDKKSLVHTYAERFGFRTVELREGEGFFVNGVKVMFKGVNRHSFWPTSGRCTSKELSIQDVRLMKEMNMNAVRMSHYPPDRHFLDVCDSLGMFVLDELTGWQDAYDTEVGKKLVKELVIRDVNHPSIVIWDNGNEGGNNLELVDDFHLYDPQNRPIIQPWQIFRGTDTNHYKDFNCCPGMLFHGTEVFFPTEFLHGLYDGGLGAGLDDYWNLMRSNSLSAGVFLWAFADEGLVRLDENNRIDTQGSNAPDGIVGPYREKEGSFFAIKEIWAPVHINRTTIGRNFNGIIEIENRYHYTNLNQCTFEWMLVNMPEIEDAGTSPIIAQRKTIPLPDTGPGLKAMVDMQLPPSFRQYDALYIRIDDPHGDEIFTYSWPIRSPQGVAAKLIRPGNTSDFTVQESEDQLTISAASVSFSFDKKLGTLSGIESDGRSISLHGGPMLATGDATFMGVEHFRERDAYIVDLQYEEAIKKARFIISADGLLRLQVEYLPLRGHYDFLGINFNYPEEKVTGVKWLGTGPYRVWKNRMKGQRFGVWEKEYNNTITGEKEWIYPEFKGYHANLYWAEIRNSEKPFKIYNETKGVYLRLYTPERPQGAYNRNTDGIFPGGNLSFMHAISPIGTKFKSADRLGPQSQKNIVEYHGGDPKPYEFSLVFDFR